MNLYEKRLKILFPVLLIMSVMLFMAHRSDDDPFSAIIKKLEIYNLNHPQEKVHLHLDKPYYAAGDDIWFKAYIINSLTTKPSDISSVLHIEIVDQSGLVKEKMNVRISSGLCWGNIKIPQTFTEGNYRIRAYTEWMKNAGPEFFFDKTIKIGNYWDNNVLTSTRFQYSKQNKGDKVDANIKFTDKNGTAYANKDIKYELQIGGKVQEKGKAKTNEMGEASVGFLNTQSELYQSGQLIVTLSLSAKEKIVKQIAIKSTSNHIDVQFFPESGNFIAGLPNKLGIKAVNNAGLGEDISGAIVDNEGVEISKFKTTLLGMGNITITPTAGKTYTAKIKFKDGSEHKVDLPKVSESGYLLSVVQNDNNILVKVLTTETLLKPGTLKLVVQHNNNVQQVAKLDNSKPAATTAISKKDLTAGIYQLTLFNVDNTPVCERLLFVNNSNDKIITHITTEKKTYKTKDELTLDFESLMDGKPIQGNFSLSVTNTAMVKADELNESNIFTSLLLSSDLTGYIEKPNYYFLNDTEKVREELDNLMLTQGWRRFIWKDVLNNTNIDLSHRPEKSLTLSGIVKKGGKPVENSRVCLLQPADLAIKAETVTDANGRFSFEEKSFGNYNNFIVQAGAGNDKKNMEIKLDGANGQVVYNNKNTGDIEVNVNEAIASYLKQSNSYFEEQLKGGFMDRANLLKEVNITVKRSSNLNGPGNADFVITADQLKNSYSLGQYLDGRIAGLNVKGGLPYLNRHNVGMKVTPMQFIFDGRMIDSAAFVQLTPAEIQLVEVLKEASKTSIYGLNSSLTGVLIITSKKAGDDNYVDNSVPGVLAKAPKYSVAKEFYSPNYKTAESQNVADHRSTVYWNPNFVNSENGRTKIKYFNSGDSGTYRVLLEGMDVTGKLCHAVYTYEVK